MKKKLLYLECNSGISGDMMVGALLDLGADEKKLREETEKLGLHDYDITVSRIKKHGIDSCAFRVEVKEEHQHHRTFGDIKKIIAESELSKSVKKKALKIFSVLAEAEAKVHGAAVDDIHFHEVGAVDSIVDIIGVAVCLDDLGITDIAVSSMAEGCGTTLCQHGRIPIPVPAVAKLAQEYGLTLRQTDVEGEMITPTGAAIVAAMRTYEAVPEEFIIRKIGIGAGTKDFPQSNILRAMIIKERVKCDDIWVLETNVDDCTGEQLGFLQELLLKKGAKDVVLRPIYMKKNRPAYQLQVLCDQELIEQVEDLIFRESTSIGIRRYRANRTVLERRLETLETPLGPAKVKVCRYGGTTFCYPEYESVRKLSKKADQGYDSVYLSIKQEAERTIGK